MNDRTEPSATWADLVGTNQGWLKRCRMAASGNPTLIAQLDDHSEAAEVLQTSITRVVSATGDPLGERTSYDWYVATALRSLTLALTQHASARQAVETVMTYARQAGLMSAADTSRPSWMPENASPPLVDWDSSPVFRELASWNGDESQQFVQLLTLDLIGRFPDTLASVTVPVVFAEDSSNAAATGPTGARSTGTLILQLLSHGPPGIHPDPRTMCFLRADRAFVESVGNAFSSAPHSLREASITYSLRLRTHAAPPITDVGGGSLGGAFAVAFRDLKKLGQVRKALRPHQLDPKCVITAAVAKSGRLSSVTALEQKVTAAHDARLRLIVAQHDLESARQTTYGSRVPIRGAATVEAAALLARGHLNPRFRTTIVAVAITLALLVTSTVVAVRFNDQRHLAQNAAHESATRRLIESDQLADRSAELLRTDPQLAGIAALAAHNTNPSAKTVNAMNAALKLNPIDATIGQVPKFESLSESPRHRWLAPRIGITSDAVWISEGGRVSGYSTESMRPLGAGTQTLDDKGKPETVSIYLSSQGNRLATLGKRRITVYAIDQDKRLARLSSIPRPAESDYPFVHFSPDASRLLIMDHTGSYRLWNPDTRKSSHFELSEDLGTIEEAIVESGGPGWNLLLSATTSEGSRLLRLRPTRPDVEVLPGPSIMSSGKVAEVHPIRFVSGAGAIVAVDEMATNGLFRFDGREWSEFPEVTTEEIDDIAVSESGEVAVVHGPYISLVGLKENRHSALASDTRYSIFTAANGHRFDSIKYISPHRLVAVDATGQVVLLDTARTGDRRVEGSLSAMDVRGGSAASAGLSGNMAVNVHSPFSASNAPGPITGTYHAPLPGRTKGRMYFFPEDVLLSDDFVAVTGSVEAEDKANQAPGTVAIWDRHSRRLIQTDSCRDDRRIFTSTVAAVTTNQDTLVASNGAAVCRWQLPSGKRLPDIHLPKFRHKYPMTYALKAGLDHVVVLGDLGVDGSRMRSAVVINTHTGAERTVPGDISDVSIAHRSDAMAVSSSSGAITISSTSATGPSRRVELSGERPLVAWSPDDTKFAVWQFDDRLQVMDAASGLQIVPTSYGFHDRVDDFPKEADELSWSSENIMVLGAPYKIYDLLRFGTWKQRICNRTVSALTWRTSISSDIPFRDPCA